MGWILFALWGLVAAWLALGAPRASIERTNEAGGPAVTVRAPRWTRWLFPWVGIAVAVGAFVPEIVLDDGGIPVKIYAVAFLVLWSVGFAIGGSLTFGLPFVHAGPDGLIGWRWGGRVHHAWHEMEQVRWTHVYGASLRMRTEIDVRPRGGKEDEEFCVLHFLYGRFRGKSWSRWYAPAFLEVCRHYGVVAVSDWEPAPNEPASPSS